MTLLVRSQVLSAAVGVCPQSDLLIRSWRLLSRPTDSIAAADLYHVATCYTNVAHLLIYSQQT